MNLHKFENIKLIAMFVLAEMMILGSIAVSIIFDMNASESVPEPPRDEFIVGAITWSNNYGTTF